jgi:uncharacterized protein (TIGR03437 family)
MRNFIALFCACVLFGLAAAQTRAQSTTSWQWRNLTPAAGQSPEARRNGAAIYDPVGKRVIVFGGTGDNGLLNDTWAFDVAARVWTRLQTTGTPPPARFAFDAVYDPAGHQLVVYSGQGSGFFNDTWTLNLTTLAWRDVSPASDSARPKKRYGSAGIFDPVSRSLVSFAGFTSESGRFNDTQSFGLASNTWQDWSPSGARPVVRCLLTAAYDRANRRMIVYGGQRSGALDDIWAFDLAARVWTELTPAQRPAGRWFANSFVDRDGRFVMFGGFTSNGNSNELWSFNLQTRQWTRLQADGGPAARNGAQTAYIEGEDRWILFGGTGSSLFNDVWELRRATAPAAVATVSAARFTGGQLTAEAIVAAFGVNLATTTLAATSTPLPTALGGASVKVTDSAGAERSAPLFFVSPTQLNFLIPAGTANGAARLDVLNGAEVVGTGGLSIVPVAPGLFSANASGQGVAAAVALRIGPNNTQRVEPVAEWNAAQNRFVALPLDLGPETEQVFLVLFGTGWRYNSGLTGVSARVGGMDAPVSFAGAQGGLAGLDQANVSLPRTLIGRGDVEVALTVDGKTANAVRVSIR